MAATVHVGSNSQMSLGSGSLVAPTATINIEGQIHFGNDSHTLQDLIIQPGAIANAGDTSLTIDRNWDNRGTFNAGNSLVHFRQGADLSQISGNNDFYRLSAHSRTGKTLRFSSGDTQTVIHDLVLRGGEGGLLLVDSSIPGEQGYLHLNESASQTIDFVEVKDSHATAQSIAPDPPETFNSIRGENVLNWFADLGIAIGARPIPTLSTVMLIVLIVTIMYLGFQRTSSNKAVEFHPSKPKKRK